MAVVERWPLLEVRLYSYMIKFHYPGYFALFLAKIVLSLRTVTLTQREPGTPRVLGSFDKNMLLDFDFSTKSWSLTSSVLPFNLSTGQNVHVLVALIVLIYLSFRKLEQLPLWLERKTYAG